ncbi:DUF6894 family protein [Methylobacterium sp. WSM2598]|uniref:DUF6894 family protein n=1 Tax=Methylobacterium sp. WSM2598 TaxID=398261 RepID=UPI000369CA28|nr:hypothetical protein [Methylobacterium sp. WSM2598]
MLHTPAAKGETFMPAASREEPPLPRYFFDVIGRDGATHDDLGQTFSCAEDARRAALRLLPEVAALERAFAGIDLYSLQVSIRDESGRVVYAATLGITGGWIA